MTSLHNMPSIALQDRTVNLNRIHELIDEIIYCDSKPRRDDLLPEPVFDQSFYENLQESLSSYLSVCLPEQKHDEYLDVFWRAFKLIGIQNANYDAEQLLSIPLVRSLVADIAEQVIERGLQQEGIASC